MDEWPRGQNDGNHCHRTEYLKKRMKRNEDSLRDLWNNLKHTNIPNMGPQKKKRESTQENIWRDNNWNLPSMGKETVNQVQEAHRVPGRIELRRNTSRGTVIKLTKIKDKLSKATREKWQITYRQTPIRLAADFLTETTYQKVMAWYI